MGWFYVTILVSVVLLVGTWRPDSGVNTLSTRIALVGVCVIVAALVFS